MLEISQLHQVSISGDRLESLLNEIHGLNSEICLFLASNQPDKKRAREYWRKIVSISEVVTRQCKEARTDADCALKISTILRAQTQLLSKMNRLQRIALAFDVSA
jgi:hypothetical protein